MSRRVRIAVAGGGVSGLASAYLLAEAGLDVTLYEAEKETGGHVASDLVEGFILDRAANGFLDSEPLTLELVRMLGLEGRVIQAHPSAARRFIYRGGKLREVKLSPPGFLLGNAASFRTKVRMAAEPLVPPRREETEETVAGFGERRLGGRFVRELLDPMVSGVFAGDVKRLSLPAAFPVMARMEADYGGLFRALFSKRKNGSKGGGPGGPGGRLTSFKGGIGELARALAEKTKAKVKTGERVRGVFPEGWRFRVETEKGGGEYDGVVVALPANSAADVLRPVSEGGAEALGGVEYAPVAVVCHGYRQGRFSVEPRGFGYLVPRTEGLRSLGTLWTSSIFKGRAPGGAVLLRTMVGGAADPEAASLTREQAVETALSENRRVMGGGAPELVKVYLYRRGIAQYNTGHLERVRTLDRLETEHTGLFITGSSVRGVSVNNCVKDAFRVRDCALSSIRGPE